MPTDLIAIAKRMTDEVAAGDDSAYDRYFTDDLELHEHIEGVPQSGVFHGQDGVRKCMAIQNATWKKTWKFTRWQYGEDLIIVYEEIVWANFKTGKAPMIPAIGVHKYRDGRICRIDVYITDEDALRDTLVP
jgi:SnoaL-like protein